MYNHKIITSHKTIVNKCGVVILAAGSSTRMGRPKQLLKYNGDSLLKQIVKKALDSNADPVIVILGANADLIGKEIENENITIVINHEWKQGMASSMIKGLKALLRTAPSADCVIFMMCDQPFISVSLLKDLIAMQQATTKPIVASNYGNTIGPPALFCKSTFPEISELKGDIGARGIIQQHANEVATVYFPAGSIDIDTAEDYESLLKNLK
ncbi:MAG: nucleotidyltransferase family protein [Ginsengibacter sp.]